MESPWPGAILKLVRSHTLLGEIPARRNSSTWAFSLARQQKKAVRGVLELVNGTVHRLNYDNCNTLEASARIPHV
jgi:hypothetical protein